MRLGIALGLVVSGVVATAAASQGGARGNAISANGACSLLTKDVLAAHTPAEKQSFAAMLTVPPMEDKVGGGGTSCSYGGVHLQLDPFPAANFEKVFGKFTPVSGVGDRAYFRENGRSYAELAVMTGGRMLTIQMGVPTGKTPGSIQSNTVGLAKAILPKLK